MKSLSDEKAADLCNFFEVIRVWAINSRGCARIVEHYGKFMDEVEAELDRQEEESKRLFKENVNNKKETEC